MSDYSRFKDTSQLPREPFILGHKPTSRERLHSFLKRFPHGAKKIDLDSIVDRLRNTIASVRLKNINNTNNDHIQRQLVRNRKHQIAKKIIENVTSTFRLKRPKVFKRLPDDIKPKRKGSADEVKELIVDPRSGETKEKKHKKTMDVFYRPTEPGEK